MDIKTVGLAVGAAAVAAAVAWSVALMDSDFEDCDTQDCHVAALANLDCSVKEAKPKKIKVKKQGADIFWWAPSGYAFCSANDGPRFKKPDGEKLYGDQFPSNMRCKATSAVVTPGTPFACPSPAPACAPYFHWQSKGTVNIKAEYDVTITNTQTNTPCTIDPWVKNG